MQQLKLPFAAPAEIAAEAQDWPRFIRRLRWQLGLSQTQFANAYRIDAALIASVESGREQPDDALAAYLLMIDRAPELIARMWMAAA